MAHAALDVVHVPSLTVGHDDLDMPACNVSAVLQDSTTRHDVLAYLATLHFLFAYQLTTDSVQLCFKLFSPCGFLISGFHSLQVFINTHGLADFLHFVHLSHKYDIRRCPVEFGLVNYFRP